MSTTEPGSTDPNTIETEIARHREDLGATVDELTGRLDVKKQARSQLADLKARGANRARNVRQRVQQAEPTELAAVAAPVVAVVVAAVVLTVVVRRVRG
ncbi:DUF3618 domain-containing protein [Janibacter sp. GS2]|uniref:DUF3618 domain-containing protein n=1 Tax=Janibacter sp. GS2 TaxID=3442646 RepID=UPI003EB939A3